VPGYDGAPIRLDVAMELHVAAPAPGRSSVVEKSRQLLGEPRFGGQQLLELELEGAPCSRIVWAIGDVACGFERRRPRLDLSPQTVPDAHGCAPRLRAGSLADPLGCDLTAPQQKSEKRCEDRDKCCFHVFFRAVG
jgi:hypothetical protein